jgi:hypothetical protein
MHIADKDLRHGMPTIRALHHLGLAVWRGPDVNFGKLNALLGQKAFRGMTESAKRRGIDFDVWHWVCSGDRISISSRT